MSPELMTRLFAVQVFWSVWYHAYGRDPRVLPWKAAGVERKIKPWKTLWR